MFYPRVCFRKEEARVRRLTGRGELGQGTPSLLRVDSVPPFPTPAGHVPWPPSQGHPEGHTARSPPGPGKHDPARPQLCASGAKTQPKTIQGRVSSLASRGPRGTRGKDGRQPLV